MKEYYSIVMIGATGAVGGEAAKVLSEMPQIERLTLLGRRENENLKGSSITQHVIDLFDPSSYQELLTGHDIAICTLGVGQPSKMSKEDFVRIDRDVVLNFASSCKKEGIQHFELLSSVGVNSKSASFYLRTKGELENGLRELNFNRLSLFHPSMILTPENRYGLSQKLTLMTWPFVSKLFVGNLRKFRGIPVDILGASIAKNTTTEKSGVEILEWSDFNKLGK